MNNSSIDLLRAVCSLAFVLGMIWLLGYLARKYGSRIGLPTALQSGPRRLKLVEVMVLDSKNKLALIRRDNTEHLILIGTDTAQIVETSISPALQGNDTP